MLEKQNTIRRKQGIIPNISEYSNILEFITSNDTQKITDFILTPENKIWEIKLADNFTFLHRACALDKKEVIITIIEKTKRRLGLDTNDINNNSQEKAENEKIFRDFINAKTDIDNQTALHLASFRGNIEVIKILISNHAEINALTTNGYNVIHKAAMGNKPSSIVYFNKKYNMDLEATDENKMTALHLATLSCMENSVIYLLNLGVNVNSQDKDGNTPLHFAIKKSQIRLIKKLIQRGADPNIPNNKRKKTPLMLAKNNPEIMEIFRKKGICEKLFFKPDISKKTLCSNKNMILFIVFHLFIILFVFFVLLPYFDSTIFGVIYLVVSCLVFILYTILSFSNPGKMVNNEYNDILDVVEKGQNIEEFCPMCLVKNQFRSKHCLICEKCVEEFDHHCFWVGNCIGKNNYTLFFIFLVFILLNTLFNIVVNIIYLITEIGNDGTEKENSSFPGFYFGNDFFIYKRIVRIIVSIIIFIIGILFFIPLVSLFRSQCSTAIEKRQTRIDEEEYEKNQLKEKLDEEVWEDLIFEEDPQSLEATNLLTNIDSDNNV